MEGEKPFEDKAMPRPVHCRVCGAVIASHWELFLHEPHCRAEKDAQAELQAMHRHIVARRADYRLWGTGVRVTRRKGDEHGGMA